MTGRQAQEIVRALRFGAEDVRGIADRLYEAKVDAYHGTLVELARAHGYDVDPAFDLSDEIDRALRADAERSATRIADTHNREVKAFVDERREQEPAAVLDAAARWLQQRVPDKADLVAITEAYSAHADATIAFYADNGVEPEFDFGDHHPEEGEAPPQCAICVKLVEQNPHPLGRVLAVGNPHPRCRQSWKARIADVDLPDELVLGQAGVAGIVGGESLISRTGGVEAAVEELQTI